MRHVLGNDHPDVLFTAENLTLVYMRLGQFDEAEPLARELADRTPEDHNEYDKRKKRLETIEEKLGRSDPHK
jgi:hypothetical protein